MLPVPTARTALLLLLFGLALRLLFWAATGDRGDAFAAAFQGDAPVWTELAGAAHRGEENELFKLPLRPPAMLWLVTLLWDGSPDGAWLVRFVFAVMGATIAPLTWLLVRLHLSAGRALFVGVTVAAASSLLQLSSGPHSEVPYLALVLVTLLDQRRLATANGRAPVGIAIRWGLLHGALCLLRAEHALTFLMLLGALAWQRRTQGGSGRTALIAIGSAVLALTPWHWIAFDRIDTYNTAGAPQLPAAGQRIPGQLPWTAEALAQLQTLPAFQQGPTFQFVSATIRQRGGRQVDAPDLDVIREAYDCWPEPIPWSFVCVYGGLNFFLANTPEADGGFSGAALDRVPPLTGGPTRYPPGLANVLPRSGTLVLSYPPHLDRLVHGYARGFEELANDPGGATMRTGKKLWHATEGAATGLGGYALPIGMSGTRRQVDLVTAQGAWPTIYRALLLLAAVVGWWRLRRSEVAGADNDEVATNGEPWRTAWLAFAASKLITVALFFGYARQGALCVPILCIGLAGCLPRTLRPRAVWLLAGALLAIELVRAFITDVTIALPNGEPSNLPPHDVAEVLVRYD